MKDFIPSHLLKRIFSFIPPKQLFTTFAVVSKEWRNIANSVRPVNLLFKNELPSREKIQGIIEATYWDIDSITVDISMNWGLNSLSHMEGVKVKVLKIGNTGISSLRPVIESSGDCLEELWLNNVAAMDKNNLISVGEFKSLKKLIMSYNENLTDEVIRSLPKKWDSLLWVDFSNCDVTDISPLANWKNLNVINLSMTEIMSVSSLSVLKRIKTLDVSNTHVRDINMITYESDIIVEGSDADKNKIEPSADVYTVGPTEITAFNNPTFGLQNLDTRVVISPTNNDVIIDDIVEPANLQNAMRELASSAAERRVALARNDMMYRGERFAEYPTNVDYYRDTGNRNYNVKPADE
jgi:F-box domain